jgi:CRISPR-associated Csx10 family RAMP protein
MMASILVTLRLLSPTCITDRPTAPGQVATTLGYLSGSALRGACVARWLAGRQPDALDASERDAFDAVFWSDTFRFGPGVPLADKACTWVVPATAWTDKRGGGWRADAGSGVRDSLVHLLRGTPEDQAILDDLEPLGEPFASSVHRYGDYTVKSLPVSRRLIMRSASRDPGLAPYEPRRGPAATGQLYSMEAIEALQQFVAIISGPDDAIDELCRRALVLNSELSLGSRRSAGDGLAVIELIDPLDVTARDAGPRIEQAHAFSEQAGASGDRRYLPVTLESDVLLRDTYLLPTSSADPGGTLSRYLDGAPGSMILRTAVQAARYIGGWDSVRGLPRAPRLATEMGSVWVFEVREPELPAAVAWWSEAERRGLGDGLNQGFGHVRLLHPMHADRLEGIW